MGEIDYGLLPPHMREGTRRYIENGVAPGDFLRAVMENKLYEALSRADIGNRYRMFDWGQFLHSIPRGCWGSPAKVKEWIRSSWENHEDWKYRRRMGTK